MITLIGITGHKRAGKDTIYSMIEELWKTSTVQRVAFADPLKEEIAKWLEITPDEINKDKEYYRPILQWYGSHKRKADPDYWIKRALVSLRRFSEGLVVFTDVRHINEAGIIKTLGGYIIKVSRPDVFQHDEHESEVNVAHIKADTTIVNSESLDRLRSRMVPILDHIKKAYRL